MSKQRIVFAGAGTAGHVEPALAVARWISQEDPTIGITFIGTKSGVENTLVPQAGFNLELITKAAFPRKLDLALFTWPWKFAQSLMQTRSIVQGASLLIGFGGYVCAPAYLMAKMNKVQFLIHEANAKAGMANKFGAALGGTPLVAFKGNNQTFKDPLEVGIPLRASITHIARLMPQEREKLRAESLIALGLDPAKPTLLIFGGSLGSMKFNEAIQGALEYVLGIGVQVIHGVGSNNALPAARQGYVPLSYISDMAQAYAAADCVISRSGAVTTTETGVLGLYSIYIPLEIGNGEQRVNAEIVASQGGGEIVSNSDFTAEFILANIHNWFEKADAYRRTGSKVDFPLDAAMRIGIKALAQLRIVSKMQGASRAHTGRKRR